ncbi:dTDP-4-dehydrorhamnose 3,5-epimerase [Marmoricola sp. Leaf446]|uniref:dTDP-4-dehydrorhamnose 3,5-epimerase n=1 Tax=Marmoricola sp. Leaf446 TaxID=1736379 RepID=UPI0006FDA0E6|nr:dTDP-4-dehydrorhamnose 3,5-epimerase [Marmoricola sp. Leaf446]KQT92266.1 dTDP-4-dehydrorhamnose 3,5-epimerase [Marmoricola sp. Leaf446]
MRIERTAIEGVAIVELERREDDRGFFARTYDRAEFEAAGLEPAVEQCNLSYNHSAGTLRGMHLQVAPHPETKLVRCVRGALVDIIVDLRPDSPTRLQHVAVELTAENRRALFVPAYFAHGFQTLVDDTEAIYQVSGAYTPRAERGLRHDDPDLALPWPMAATVISDKDRSWPLLAERPASDFDPLEEQETSA